MHTVMKRKNSRRAWCHAPVVIGIVSCLFMTGCLYRGVKVVGLEKQAAQIEATSYTVLGESEGTSSSFNLFWLIPVTPRINYEAAAREAINSLRGDSMIDVRTWIERQIWIVGMVEILHVKGKIIHYEK